MQWTIKATDHLETWLAAQDTDTKQRFIAAVDHLKANGPLLGRPLVDTIEGSRHSNMKELRSGTIRALFAFDPRRHGIILLAGDKRDKWKQWYDENLPVADDLTTPTSPNSRRKETDHANPRLERRSSRHHRE